MKPEQLKYSILKKAFSGQLVMVDSDSEKPKVKAMELEETPYDIPDDWFWSNLGNCCEMYTGNSISETVKKAKYTGLKEGYDYIATKDVTFEHTIEYDNGVRIPVDDDFRIAYNGSVLMCIEGGSAGRKIGILDRDVCFGNKLCTFNSKEIVNRYIYYYLQSHEFKAFFMDNMSGIIGGVSIKKLKELPIPVPTVSEQKAIVAKIEELLTYVDRYAEAYEKLEQFNSKFPEEMKKSILQYAIQGKLVEQRPEEGTAEELYQQIQDEKQKLIKEGKIKKEKPLADITETEIPFDIPESWKWVYVGDLFNHNTGKAMNSSAKKTDKAGSIRKFITTSNVYWNSLDFTNVKEMFFSADELDRCTISKGDMLMCEGGAYYGRTAIWDYDYNICFQNHVHRLRPYMKLDLLYFYYVFYFYRNSGLMSSKGTAMPGLSSIALHQMIIPLPPLEEQHRIVAKIEEILPHCDRLVK